MVVRFAVKKRVFNVRVFLLMWKRSGGVRACVWWSEVRYACVTWIV